MKKLLMTASTFPRYFEDTEPRFIYDLAKEFTKYYDVTVLVPFGAGSKEYEILEGIKIIRYHYFPIHKWESLCYPGAILPRIKEKKVRIFLVPFLFLSLFIKLRKMLPQFDIVHANWIIPQGIVHSFCKKKYILTGLGGDVTSLNSGILGTLKKRTLNKAEKVIVVSKHLKNSLEEMYGLKNVEVIPMGCDTSMFTPDNKVSDFFNQGNDKVILFVGRLVEKKGCTYLIEAMKEINAKLIIVGDGPEKTKLMAQAENMKHKINFVGAKNKHELKNYYASCDIICVPSIKAKDGDQDGLPVALIEAMASGAVPVASDTGGISEAIEDGQEGYLVSPGNVEVLRNRINTLLENEMTLFSMSNNARKRALDFEFKNIAEKYVNIFENV